MLHQLKLCSAVALATVMACAAPSTASNGDPMTITTFQNDTLLTVQPVTNDCNGETVILNGSMHFDYFFATDADGDHTRYDVTSTGRLTGVGQPPVLNMFQAKNSTRMT